MFHEIILEDPTVEFYRYSLARAHYYTPTYLIERSASAYEAESICWWVDHRKKYTSEKTARYFIEDTKIVGGKWTLLHGKASRYFFPWITTPFPTFFKLIKCKPFSSSRVLILFLAFGKASPPKEYVTIISPPCFKTLAASSK